MAPPLDFVDPPAPMEEPIHFFEDRKRVYPKAVRGPVRRAKWAILVSCLTIYYLLPWLRWDRGPGRPQQALLLDIWNERFYAFNLELWPQEIYFLTGLLVLGAVGLFLVTSLVGRVWCGYTCPQTVWTDLFIWLERLIEGDRNERIKRDSGPLSFDKVWRKLAKHAAWLGVAFWTGGAWIMYYVDAPTVTGEFWTGRASIEVYVMTALFTATTYLLAGWAREQVCTYMCPWPRFQAAMFDEQTVTTTYQSWRGDPRGRKPIDGDWSGRGDCIDCRQCVHVCPTGIDIRDGAQLGCINCGLCIDACNQVMTKIGRPQWLITWDNLIRQSAKARSAPIPGLSIIRPRTLIYLTALSIVGGLMTAALLTRAQLGLSIQRDRAPLFVTLANGSTRDAYTIKLANKADHRQRLQLTMSGLDAELALSEGSERPSAILEVPAEADGVTTYRLLVHATSAVHGSVPILFHLSNPETGETAHAQSVFIGPGGNEKVTP